MGSLFQLPDEILISTLSQVFPCREPQIRALTTLFHPQGAPCKNLIIYGTKSTGKTAVTTSLLSRLSSPDDSPQEDWTLRHAIVSSAKCITGRHLFETAVAEVTAALQWDAAPKRCENLAQLAVELSRMLKYAGRPEGFRFVLVFDGIDRQREAPGTLLPALGRLHEIIPCLTTVFILTIPPPLALRTTTVTHLEFPNYTKPEFVKILSLTPPPTIPTATPEETTDLWTRFCGVVHDSLTRSASRTLPSFRTACEALWPRFVAPIQAGTHAPREFSKLLIAARVHFQDEALLNPSIVAAKTPGPNEVGRPKREDVPPTELATLLPTVARLLLLAAYLASHNPAKHDLTVFSTHNHFKKRRKGGAGGLRGRKSKHRKIARKLLGAQSFVMERMMAIFSAVRAEWDGNASAGSSGMDADVCVAIATLSSLRLLVRVGAGTDLMDRGARWRINVSWEGVRSVGRSLGVEVEDWLIE